MKPMAFLLCAFLVLAGCATGYGPASGSITGGHSVKHLEDNIYRVAFYGNGYTTVETVQTYWLYKCTEVTMEYGFDGFEILSDIRLTRNYPVEEFFRGENPYKKAQMIFVPMDVAPKPELVGDIRLLKAPFEAKPPKVFDALKLQLALDPYVYPPKEERCSMGNVCEHVHKYLHPEGKFDSDL